MKPPKFILPVIIISQFFCTSLWFAGNGVMHELMLNFHLEDSAVGNLTSAVQLGFIMGTLIFAILCIADRYAPSRVFFLCAIAGAFFNLGIIWEGHTLASLLSLRFLTGFFLAGIYPIGMKIASDYYQDTLGKSLGYLVGALVLGTAFPHLLKELGGSFPWEFVIIATTSLAAIGGLLMLFLVPDGPFRKPSQQIQLSAFFDVFRKPDFRAAAFGYFGHMWELYTFWAFVPVILYSYTHAYPETTFNIPLWSFLIIGTGGLACIMAGYIAQQFHPKQIAFISLLLSCCCCLAFPLVFILGSSTIFIAFLLFWGMVVIADSPLFSTLVALEAPSELKGTALTIVNSIGFAVTIVSLQAVNALRAITDSNFIFITLSVGPILGLVALSTKRKKSIQSKVSSERKAQVKI